MSCTLGPNVMFSSGSNFVRICAVLEAKAWLGLTCSSWMCWHWMFSSGATQCPYSVTFATSLYWNWSDLIVCIFGVQLKEQDFFCLYYQLQSCSFLFAACCCPSAASFVAVWPFVGSPKLQIEGLFQLKNSLAKKNVSTFIVIPCFQASRNIIFKKELLVTQFSESAKKLNRIDDQHST